MCFNNVYMKLDLILNEPIFYNLLHESGYIVRYPDNDASRSVPIFEPKNKSETPKLIEININHLYAIIQSSKGDFRSEEKKTLSALMFANSYGLLSATKNIRYYDPVHGNFYWYDYAQNGNEYNRFTEEIINKNFERDIEVNWVKMLSGQIKPDNGSAVFPPDLFDIASNLSGVEVIFNHTKEIIEHIPKTLGAALTLFHLENHNKANKSCKECGTRFIDLTKPQKAKFCSEKCKSSNYRQKKVYEHIKKYHAYNEQLDLSKTTFTDYKNNSLTIFCKERGKRNISCEDFIQNPTYPE